MDQTRARAEMIEAFAAALRELRSSVGNPSFREMSGRSGAISHTTLHEATKGHRLPSWETTVEFVRACGADPAGYRERWEAANVPVRPVRAWDREAAPSGELALSGAGDAERPAVHLALDPQASLPAAGEAPAPVPPPSEEIGRPAPGRPRTFRPAVAVLVTVAVCAVIAVIILPGSDADRGTTAAPSAAPTEPRIPGDISQFVGDVTIPDGTTVKPGQRFKKTWEILNAGKVVWSGRFLARGAYPADNGSCETPAKVPVPETRPGKKIQVSVPVTAPMTNGSCWVGWKMVDGEGNAFLPGARPIYFVVNVRG